MLFRSHSRNTKNIFCKLYSIYTRESVQNLHLVFHQMVINDGVDIPENWFRIDISLENATLANRDKPLNNIDSRRGASKSSLNDNSDVKPVLFRFNKGQEKALIVLAYLPNMWRRPPSHKVLLHSSSIGSCFLDQRNTIGKTCLAGPYDHDSDWMISSQALKRPVTLAEF